ncbi:MAG: hypothetical protein JWQ40_3953 [Segetibacter sp.]|nr:hypothetical protein [Segetibacter sp.]
MSTSNSNRRMFSKRIRRKGATFNFPVVFSPIWSVAVTCAKVAAGAFELEELKGVTSFRKLSRHLNF